jgi:hypothetical protein
MENDMPYQLVPHPFHRRNAADPVIQTFKEKNIAGSSSVDQDFPMHIWDRLLPQADMKLNVPHTSRMHLQLSAATHFHR